MIRSGLVYVLLREEDRHIKIGRCVRHALTPRLADLRHRFGALTLLHTEAVKDNSAVEKLAHEYLKEYRRYGEFFEVSPEVGIDAVRRAASQAKEMPAVSAHAPMQIRSVPVAVRKFYNDLAYAEGCSLGELLTRIAEGQISVPTMGAVLTAKKPSSAQSIPIVVPNGAKGLLVTFEVKLLESAEGA